MAGAVTGPGNYPWLADTEKKGKLPGPKDLDSFNEKKFLIDSCRMWTRQGLKMKNLEQAIKARQSF
ncbi:MAG TPA: hypothetical protein ENK36_03025 [Desulfobacterales bacterium]|nr:hypothetical protein [Deltaproteobacteria bacterium]HGY11321.1 hypothetical protein [Desulfobacterales bacterium]